MGNSAALSFPLELVDVLGLASERSPTSHRFPKEQHETVLMVNFIVLTCKVLVSSCGKDHMVLCSSKLYQEVFAK